MDAARRTETTRLVRSAVAGDAAAAEQLLPLVYEELRSIAGRLVRDQRSHTLQPTELIHEAYLRLADDEAGTWEGQEHFTRVAARAMRYVLVDRARARRTQKRGGQQGRVTLDTQLAAVVDQAEQMLFVDEGLTRLAAVDEELARIVEMRFFGGMAMAEIAHVLEVSTSTVDRGWRTARAWWIREFGDPGGDDER